MEVEEQTEVSESQIAVHWREEEYYPPPESLLAQANAKLASTSLQRDLKAGTGVGTSFQQIDQSQATVKTTESQVESAGANIKVNE